MKNETTEALVKTRESMKAHMEVLQVAGLWDHAARFHAAIIAPINAELEMRGVW